MKIIKHKKSKFALQMTKEKLTSKDYYFLPNGLMVFTAHYLLKRGYCCGNGCLHCPYKKDQKKS